MKGRLFLAAALLVVGVASNPVAPTPPAGDSSNRIATTARIWDTMNFATGLITSVVNTKTNFVKFFHNANLLNMTGSVTSQTCSVAPAISLYECGADPTCASPTTMASVTVSGTGMAFPATISGTSILAGDYVAWGLSAGTCSSLSVTGSAQTN